jgi:hypothetical protein
VTPNPNHEQIDAWCTRVLGSPVDQVLFEAGFASRVLGLRLRDGTAVVAKVRRFTPRLAGATLVQTQLWEAGFPCPRPLVGPTPLGDAWITAEALVDGGLPLTDDLDAPELYASALARLLHLAPPVSALPTLVPPPSWAHWDHTEPGLWPRRGNPHHDDLNLDPDPPWLREAAVRVRARLRQWQAPSIVGHADWWSENLRWVGRQLHLVYDWDSVTAQPEAILVGCAAYMFAKTTVELDGCAPGASVPATEHFLAAYERARGRSWTADELQVAWAAGLWVAVFDCRVSRIEDRGEGFADQVQAETPERLRRAGV